MKYFRGMVRGVAYGAMVWIITSAILVFGTASLDSGVDSQAISEVIEFKSLFGFVFWGVVISMVNVGVKASDQNLTDKQATEKTTRFVMMGITVLLICMLLQIIQFAILFL